MAGDLAHVIDDDGNSASLAVSQDVIEQGGFPSSEEAGEDGDWELRCH
jgi:hypothetical protein